MTSFRPSQALRDKRRAAEAKHAAEALKNYVPKEGEHVLWPGFPPVTDEHICNESNRVGKHELCEKWNLCKDNEERKEVFRELAFYVRKYDRIAPTLPPCQNLDIPPGCKKDHVQLIAHWSDEVKVYEVTFSFELVFGSKNARIKRFNSWETKFKAFLQNSSLKEIISHTGMKVKLVSK